MSDGALDLSLTSSYEVNNTQRHHPHSRTNDPVSSDSGRASSDSTSSDIHEESNNIKPRFRTSPSPRMMSSPSGGALPPPPPPSGGVGSLPLPAQSDPSSNSTTCNSIINTHHLGPPISPKSPVAYSPSARLRNLPPSQQQLTPSPQQQHLNSNNITSYNGGVGAPNPRSSVSPVSRAGDSAVRLSNPNSPEASASSSASLQEDGMKPLPLSSMAASADRGSDPRVAPIRPFKMYPVDAYSVYNSQLLPGSGSGISSSVGIQSLYDSSASPSSFGTFPLTPLTSHLLQRKRRAELRDNANSLSPAPIKSESGSPVTTVNSSSPVFGNSGVSTTLLLNREPRKRSSSSEGQENETEEEKRAKLVPDEQKDDAYWDRRRKNNEAAKRSRDARRQKEEEIAMRAAFLEQENLKLRAQVAILKNETAKLHYMLYNRI